MTQRFNIIGDVHGCISELEMMLDLLGDDRPNVFVGDLVDRGPNSYLTTKVVKERLENGDMCVRGNHDDKLARCLNGNNVRRIHGLNETMEQLETQCEPGEMDELKEFLETLPLYLVLDGGKLVVAHGGMPRHHVGRDPQNKKGLQHCLYGETDGTKNAEGFPTRTNNWCAQYQDDVLCVYGHTPVMEPVMIHNTVNVDTGCAFGNKLTAMRYPEMEFVSVDALGQYAYKNGVSPYEK